MLDVVCAGAVPTPAELLRLKDVTVELVALMAAELKANPRIWSPNKLPDQENLRDGILFDHLMRLRPPLVNADVAGVLADKLMAQAKASHDRLMQT